MRWPDWTKKYWIESTGARMRTSSPVSSSTSRRAVCSIVSAPSGVPFGSDHVTPSRSRRRLPSTISSPCSRRRTTIPPAEVARAVGRLCRDPFLSRANARNCWPRSAGPRRTGWVQCMSLCPTSGDFSLTRSVVAEIDRAARRTAWSGWRCGDSRVRAPRRRTEDPMQAELPLQSDGPREARTRFGSGFLELLRRRAASPDGTGSDGGCNGSRHGRPWSGCLTSPASPACQDLLAARRHASRRWRRVCGDGNFSTGGRHVEVEGSWCEAPHGFEMVAHRAEIAAGQRAGECLTNAQRFGICPVTGAPAAHRSPARPARPARSRDRARRSRRAGR